MLLLEVMRRAAHDWVLYRASSRLLQRQIAEEAYNWIFKEDPGGRAWVERAYNKKELTSFVSICEVLSLDPDVVRTYIKGLTIKEILSTGRPPTYRRQKERRKKPVLILLPPPPPVLQLPAPIIILRPQLVRPISPPLIHLLATASNTVSLLVQMQG
jgi:hypothetical protein